MRHSIIAQAVLVAVSSLLLALPTRAQTQEVDGVTWSGTVTDYGVTFPSGWTHFSSKHTITSYRPASDAGSAINLAGAFKSGYNGVVVCSKTMTCSYAVGESGTKSYPVSPNPPHLLVGMHRHR